MTTRYRSYRKRRVVGKPFDKGYDARRHILTHEERVRGGRASWAMTMHHFYRDLARGSMREADYE